MQYESVFPTVIGFNHCPFFNEIKGDYISMIKELPKTTSAGDVYYQFHKDRRFDKLNNWVTESVNDYAIRHKFPDNYLPGESWAIDYKNDHGQGFHAHSGWVMSTIFYLQSDNDEANTIFRSPYYNDMQNPLGLGPKNSTDVDKYNEYTYRTYRVKPIEGMLVIFRSYLEHAVELKKSDNIDRIIMSYNYQKEKYI